jgi:hypothetical protein
MAAATERIGRIEVHDGPFASTVETIREINEGDSHTSALSWSAIFAGAVAAAALSLILLMLGTGLGLSSASPWVRGNVASAPLGVSTILWLTFAQLAASGLGGYLAGRLRKKWLSVHSHEIYFRDTAHGFLAWAVATLVTAALLTSTIASMLGVGVHAAAPTAATVAADTAGHPSGSPVPELVSSRSQATSYYVDSIFRSDPSSGGTTTQPPSPAGGATVAPEPNRAATLDEAGRIFANAYPMAALPATDAKYLGQLVSQRTGLPQTNAEARVSAAYGSLVTQLRAEEEALKASAETARRSAASTALWLFISLLIGAFIASLAATVGGRMRDASPISTANLT